MTTAINRTCAYDTCENSVDSPDGYAWGGVPLVLSGELRKLADGRLDLACFHCWNTKTLSGITVDGYGQGFHLR